MWLKPVVTPCKWMWGTDMKCPICNKNLAAPRKVDGRPYCPGCGWTLPVMVEKANDASELTKEELEAALAELEKKEDEAEALAKAFNAKSERKPNKARKLGRGSK